MIVIGKCVIIVRVAHFTKDWKWCGHLLGKKKAYPPFLDFDTL